MTYHSLATTLDEGVLPNHLYRPEVRKALVERMQAVKGR